MGESPRHRGFTADILPKVLTRHMLTCFRSCHDMTYPASALNGMSPTARMGMHGLTYIFPDPSRDLLKLIRNDVSTRGACVLLWRV